MAPDDDITWKTLSEKFVPRSEQDAANLHGRLSALEQFRIEITTRVIEAEARMRELVITTVGQAVKDALQKELIEKAEENRGLKGQWVVYVAVAGGVVGIVNGIITIIHGIH